MSYIRTFNKIPELNNSTFHFEFFNSAGEVVEKNRTRKITDSDFDDQHEKYHDIDWSGVSSFEEAEDLLKNGYQPSVEKLRAIEKCELNGIKKRMSMINSIEGFQPIVPLAIMGVPNSMLNVSIKPIKSKVIDIYYDITVNCNIESKDLIQAGIKLLSALLKLEAEGYRFNIYAIQEYQDKDSKLGHVLCVKVKDSNKPLDLKRLSYPLTHTSFFRVIGFDWYSRFPLGSYLSGYGRALGYDYNNDKINSAFKNIFGNNCVVISAKNIIVDKTPIESFIKTNNLGVRG